MFVHLTAIDILSKYPVQAEAFLRDIRPTELGRIPEHPAERSQDLFFLDTSEHFTLTLPPQICETLLLDAALPYLGTGSDSRLLELFETAHSVVLAIFSAPQNYSIVVKHLPMYLNSLFGVSYTVICGQPCLQDPRTNLCSTRRFHKTSLHANSDLQSKHLSVLRLHHPTYQNNSPSFRALF